MGELTEYVFIGLSMNDKLLASNLCIIYNKNESYIYFKTKSKLNGFISQCREKLIEM